MNSEPAASGSIPTSIAPWLSVRNSAHAVEFYKSAFGATEVYRMEDPGGGVVAKLSVDGAEFWLSDESPEHGNFSPESLGGGSVRMILTVTDPDAVFARAIAAGASEVFPVGEEHGWRLGRVVDPFGHHWEQSRRPVLTNLPEKCDRKPETVVVTLVEADQEYDHVSLDLARDFKLADPSAYAPRSEIVLHGPPGAPLIP